jgi:alkanesulfonate monooxygenase SsuD/methylene tetrahydromethanopterin reductase-like flavin-dependent oxidoreductase (luciferase family)
MHLSTVILPIHPWRQARTIWQRAEDLGFRTAYTYDHLSWRVPFRDGPWFGAVPTLTAAATATEHLRLGTLVTSPNFRHPVTLAKEAVSIDDISGGRLTVGIGAGGSGFDATALGNEAWTPRERADRFGEFVPLLDRLLTQDETTSEGRHYSAHEVRMLPGCVQQPRLPLYIAATGPRGLRLAAEHGQGWITYGDPKGAGSMPPALAPDVIATQLGRLEAACAQAGRDPGELDKVLMHGSTQERALDSLDAFVDYAGRYAELGITEIVLHWPIPDTVYEADLAVFEKIAAEGLNQLK